MQMKNQSEYTQDGKMSKHENSDSEMQKLGYTILEVKDGNIVKMKIELLGQSRKIEEDNEYEKNKFELLKKIEKEWLIVKFTKKGYEIVETSKKLGELLNPKKDEKKDEENPPVYDNTLRLNDYLKYEIISQQLYMKFSPKKAVSVGDSWQISIQELFGDPFGGNEIEGEEKIEPGEDDTKKEDIDEDKIESMKFVLEKVESKDETEIATITFSQKMEQSDSFETPEGKKETYLSKSELKGIILFDLKKKLILSTTIEIVSSSVSMRDNKEYGNSKFSNVTKTVYSYSK